MDDNFKILPICSRNTPKKVYAESVNQSYDYTQIKHQNDLSEEQSAHFTWFYNSFH